MPKINAISGSSNGRYHKPARPTLTDTLIWTPFPSSAKAANQSCAHTFSCSAVMASRGPL